MTAFDLIVDTYGHCRLLYIIPMQLELILQPVFSLNKPGF